MAKIKHNNFIDTVDEVFAGAKKEGVLHLYAEDEYLNGKKILRCYLKITGLTKLELVSEIIFANSY